MLGLTPMKPNSTDIASRETMKSLEIETMNNEDCLGLDSVPSDEHLALDNQLKEQVEFPKRLDLSDKVSASVVPDEEARARHRMRSNPKDGSPLVINNQLVGVFAVNGYDCYTYSIVSHHYDWIKSEMENILA